MPCSAASTPLTTTSAISGAPIPACLRRCTYSPHWGEQDRPLSELMAEYTRYAASGEINSTVADAADRTAAVLAAFADRTESVDRLDGVTVSLEGNAWFNLRASNTELAATQRRSARLDVDALVNEILAIVRAESESDRFVGEPKPWDSWGTISGTTASGTRALPPRTA